MPTNPKGYMGDYYNKNKEKFNNPKETAKRKKRNEARRMMIKAVGKAKLKGKDIDHIKSLKNGGSNKRSNLRIVSIAKNRGRK